MAHYAFINNENIVDQVIVGIDETELIEGKSPEIWYAEFKGMMCKRTSYNAATNGFRFNYAAIGYIYDADLDAFYPPKCHEGAELSEKCQWICIDSDHGIPGYVSKYVID